MSVFPAFTAIRKTTACDKPIKPVNNLLRILPSLIMVKRREKIFTKLIRLSPLRLIVGEAVFLKNKHPRQ